jgi:hypothetical protein
MVALSPRLVTDEERQRQRRLTIAAADDRALSTWRENFPQDIIDENHTYYWIPCSQVHPAGLRA